MREAGGVPPALWFTGADTAAVAAALAAADPSAARWPTIPPTGGPARLAVVAPDDRKLRLAARIVARGERWHGRSDVWFSPDGIGRGAGRVAVLFPGVEPGFAAEVDDVARWFGVDAPVLDASSLGRRSAAIVRLGLFLHERLVELGVRADVMAGHSLGEWTGTVASGLVPGDTAESIIGGLDLDALPLPPVEFAAIGAGADRVAEVVDGRAEVVISHDNCPRQSVVCGTSAAIDAALGLLAGAGILGGRLDFRSGFHTPLLAPLLDDFRAHLDRLAIGPGQVPLWSATSVAPYPTEAEAIRDLHLRHLIEPVRFRPLVERLHDAGARVFVQCGVGSLTSFVGDTLDGRPHLAVAAHTTRHDGLGALARVIAALWVEGVDVDPAPLAAPVHERVAPSRAAGTATSPARASVAAPTRPARSVPSVPSAPPIPAAPCAPAAAASPTPAATSPAAPPPIHPVLAAYLAATGVATEQRAAVLGAWSTRHDPTRRRGRAGATSPFRSARQRWRAVTSMASGGVDPTADAVAATTDPGATTPLDGGRAGGDPAPLVRPAGPGGRTGWLELSLASLPEVVDHALMRQPEGWHDVADTFPVVPLTTQLELFADLARGAAPGRHVAALRSVRALKWLDLLEPVSLAVDHRWAGPDEVHLAHPHARATVVLTDRPLDRPPASLPPVHEGLDTTYTARGLFEEHVMFHGPAFQGLVELGPFDDDGIVGRIEVLPGRGAVLDDIGKLVAYHVMERQGWGDSSFPLGVDEVALFGDPPPVGAVLDAVVRIRTVDGDRVRADAEVLAPDGRVWCRITGWSAHIFHADERTTAVQRHPDRHLLGEPQPEGWVLVRERWPSGAARDLIARRYLDGEERRAYEALNLRAQRAWLLGRIAVKDAVRHHLAGLGQHRFPVEVRVTNDAAGRPAVTVAGLDLDLHVTLAHAEWAAVAMVDVAAPVGIDVVEVVERPTSFDVVALSLAERTGGGPPRIDRATWQSATWAAKEAAGKARGTGLAGRPADLAVEWSVDGSIHALGHPVGWRTLAPTDLTAASGAPLLVAWTRHHPPDAATSAGTAGARRPDHTHRPEELSR